MRPRLEAMLLGILEGSKGVGCRLGSLRTTSGEFGNGESLQGRDHRVSEGEATDDADIEDCKSARVSDLCFLSTVVHINGDPIWEDRGPCLQVPDCNTGAGGMGRLALRGAPARTRTGSEECVLSDESNSDLDCLSVMVHVDGAAVWEVWLAPDAQAEHQH